MSATVLTRVFTALFIIAALLSAASAGYRLPHAWHYWSKPAMMGILLMWLFSLRTRPAGWLFLALALLLSLVGDVSLMYTSELSFMLGLGAFALAHISYIVLNVQEGSPILEVPLLRRHPWLIFASILYALWMYLQVKDGAGQIAWAVLMYVLLILAMWLSAWHRHGRVPTRSFILGVLGAGLFLLSDSLLAWDRFKSPIEYRDEAVLWTYAAAQYVLFRGYLSNADVDAKGA